MKLRILPFPITLIVYILIACFPGVICSHFSRLILFGNMPLWILPAMIFAWILGPYIILSLCFLLFTKHPSSRRSIGEKWYVIYRIVIVSLLFFFLLMIVVAIDNTQKIAEMSGMFASEASGFDTPWGDQLFSSWLAGVFSGLIVIFYTRYVLLKRLNTKPSNQTTTAT